jgi:proteasome lid subunit RPN8/RPN11
MAKKKPKKEDSEDYGQKLHSIIDEFGLDVEISDLREIEGIKERITEVTEAIDAEADTLMEGIDSEIGYYDQFEAREEEKEKPVLDPIFTPIYVNYKAYKRMVGYAMRYANDKAPMKNWREVYGILIGAVEEDTLIVVKDAIPMVVGDRAGVKYENKQYVDMAQIDQSLYDRAIENDKTDFIVGWWHTHPGFGFFFSETDAYTHLGYQIPNPYAIGLIFDHCEKKEDFLGIAALRLTDPHRGILSDFRIAELHYDLDEDEIKRKITKVIENNRNKLDKALKEISFIDKVLRRKKLAQLQRNFGLILVPKKDIKKTEDEEEAEEDDELLYVWDPEYFKKSYRIPKFRQRVEAIIQKYEMILNELLEKKQLEQYKTKREKFRKKIHTLLEKPNIWYHSLMQVFGKKIEIIYPIYDYLDTDERKVIEYFEERAAEYFKILENLNNKAKFEK